MLLDNAITINIEGIIIRVPHPAAYALHKFIIFRKRAKPEKAQKDLEGALNVFNYCLRHDDKALIPGIFNGFHPKWRKTIIKNLEEIGETEIVKFLKTI